MQLYTLQSYGCTLILTAYQVLVFLWLVGDLSVDKLASLRIPFQRFSVSFIYCLNKPHLAIYITTCMLWRVESVCLQKCISAEGWIDLSNVAGVNSELQHKQRFELQLTSERGILDTKCKELFWTIYCVSVSPYYLTFSKRGYPTIGRPLNQSELGGLWIHTKWRRLVYCVEEGNGAMLYQTVKEMSRYYVDDLVDLLHLVSFFLSMECGKLFKSIGVCLLWDMI